MKTILLIVIGLTVVALLVVLLRNIGQRWVDYYVLKHEVVDEKERLAFLINQDFEVKETNYYAMKSLMKDDQPRILGNVLHCKNGCDSGKCGTGLACKSCPVRYVIRNSFLQHRDFEKVAVTMNLYDEHHQAQEVDVEADGELGSVNSEPYMVVKIRPKKEE